MTNTKQHNALNDMVERYPWWSGGRVALTRNGGSDVVGDPATMLVSKLHPLALLPTKAIDIARLTHLSTDDLIDRFLKREEYRIVAEDGAADDLATVDFDLDEDMVSEDLAEIYANQGLYDEAIDTYRKLSLLNSEKSIYFAGLIAKLKEKKDRN